jgi:hypothetical protein
LEAESVVADGIGLAGGGDADVVDDLVGGGGDGEGGVEVEDGDDGAGFDVFDDFDVFVVCWGGGGDGRGGREEGEGGEESEVHCCGELGGVLRVGWIGTELRIFTWIWYG